jgi:hypothetical protein
MRTTPNDVVEQDRIEGPYGENNGAFLIRRYNAYLRVRVSDGLGWDHVSVSLSTRCPTWEEMTYICYLFFEEEEEVMQLRPAKSNYANVHKFTLHWWRPQSRQGLIPLPPLIAV